jgi:hypothetical protein
VRRNLCLSGQRLDRDGEPLRRADPFLKEVGQRQMGEGLVRCQGDQLSQKVLRHGRIAQFPVGMGEVQLDDGIRGIE